MEKNVESLLESVDFIVKNMATKIELQELEQRLSRRMDTVELGLGQRIDGISKRLDYELDRRHQMEVRVTTLEKRNR